MKFSIKVTKAELSLLVNKSNTMMLLLFFTFLNKQKNKRPRFAMIHSIILLIPALAPRMFLELIAFAFSLLYQLTL